MSKEDKIIKEHKRFAEKQKEMYELQRIRTISLETKNNKLEKIIDEALIHLDILQEIIYKQPSENRCDDFWLLDKLDGIKNILKGGKRND